MKRKVKRRLDYEDGSGNVFADLGLRNAKQELLKAKLTVEIYRLLKKRGVTQNDAAKLLGTTQAQVSALMRCKPASRFCIHQCYIRTFGKIAIEICEFSSHCFDDCGIKLNAGNFFYPEI